MGRPFKIHPQQLCECGCGELTMPDNHYIYGHNRLGQKNPRSWLCAKEGQNKIQESITKEVIEKRAKSFKKRYDSGYINPMKGKILSKATKQKISKNNARYWLNKKRPDEHIKNMTMAVRKGYENGTRKPVFHYIRKNSPYIWDNVKFDSKEEMEVAKILLNRPKEGLNCHIIVKNIEIDFYLEEENLFVEYHPWDMKGRTTDEYQKEREGIILKSKYKEIPLIILENIQEAIDGFTDVCR